MKTKNILWMLLTLTLPALVGCQMLKNRKPQSAGSTAYCSNCLVEKIDKDVKELRDTIQNSNPRQVKYQSAKTPVPVRSAVVFNKEGKPVCRVDLLKHPNLIPNFAKPAEQMVYQASKSKRGLASVEEDSELPPCTDKYFSLLKKVATNNVVLNSDKSHIRKTGLAKKAIITTVCILGAFALDNHETFIDEVIVGTTGVGSTILSKKVLEPKIPVLADRWRFDVIGGRKDKHRLKLNKVLMGNMMAKAGALSSLCYIGASVADAVGFY